MYSSLAGLATNSNDALAAVQANLSPRQRELENLERFALGTQYEGLPDWFDDDGPPLWERAPCIVYKIVATAIRSNVELVLGEGRFPTLTSNPGEDDSEAEGLDEEQSQRVDRALDELLDRVRFRTVLRQALEHAQQAKSVAVIAGCRRGKPFLELVRSRWCEPTFDADGCVTSLEIRYPYLAWEKQPDGKWRVRARLYRRVVDAISDTTYLPVDAAASGAEPPASAWVPDPAKTIENHGLGFCPVHWYAHMRECSTVADYDGRAIHETELDEIRGLDFALSQRHRAALFCGDPQIVEIGVDPGTNPSGMTGRAAVVPSSALGGKPSSSNPVTGAYVTSGGQSARVKSPGAVWQYEQKAGDVSVEYLVLPAYALQALDEHASDLRNKIAEGLSVVILDPQNVKHSAEMSGKAIEQLYARQFNRCDQIRDDVSENLLLPVAKLTLRVALATDIRMKSIDAVRGFLQLYISDESEAPRLFVRWPRGYTKPDPTDELAIVQATVSARNAKVITARMALEKLAPIYGVDNVDQAEEALEKERTADEEKMHEAMNSLGGGGGKDKPDPAKPPADVNDGGATAAAA